MVKRKIPGVIRRLILSWLAAVAVETLLLPERSLDGLESLNQMSLLRLVLVAAVAFAVLPRKEKWERWLLVGVYALLAGLWLAGNYTPAFFFACWLMLAAVCVYALYGWDDSAPAYTGAKGNRRCLWITVGLTAALFLLLCLWTVCRVLSFSTPTFDFGIFAQMFHNMAESGLPITTVERDGPLSHFAVHVSPIYYVMLPFYILAPHPITLQVLQAAVVSSSVVPFWLLAKHHGLPGYQRMLLCALLLLSPAFAGGVSYDLHENCFLTPLILWLLYTIEKKRHWFTLLFAVLVWMVKEDAAVYVAVVGLWLLVRRDVRGAWLLGGSVFWFFAVTGYLSRLGDGVMTGRYDNFLYDGSGSLLTVVKAVVINPMKAVYECVDEEKLRYIGLTMGPLLGLPLLTRRYERYILLIPYLLVNLMSDYKYQHDIYFQYNFGSQALLIYLTLVNLADLKWKKSALLGAVLVAAILFSQTILPKAMLYPEKLVESFDRCQRIHHTLERIPEEAGVGATTYYTTELSRRETLYDVKYASREHLLSCEYIVLDVSDSGAYQRYGGLDGLIRILEASGYERIEETEYTMIYQKSPA